jgi:hypothetical protein
MATDPALAELQRIIDRSARTAGQSIARNFIGGGWRMTAEEFVGFWEKRPMASISTVSAAGEVHVAPLELSLVGTELHVPTFADSVRLRDHRANPRCGITAWDGPYRAVIVYGNASEESLSATTTASGMVTVVVRPTRIYGIRPPAWHHAANR